MKSRKAEMSVGVGREKSYLSLYTEQPTEEITLEDFEVFALNRLRVLKAIEAARTRGDKMDALKDLVKKECEAHMGGDLTHPRENGTWPTRMGSAAAHRWCSNIMPGTPPPPLVHPTTAAEVVRIDQISHHILRLAFANSEDKRRWLLTHEVLLFRARFSASVAKQQQYFMQQHGLQFVTVPKPERDALRDELHAVQSIASSKPGVHPASDDKFYRVPFIQALDLVARRQALVRGGFVYVPQAALESLVVARFRASVCDALPL